MKTINKIGLVLFLAIFPFSGFSQNFVENDSLKQIILEKENEFWNAYNSCDIETIKGLLAEDVEFYHDKGGLTLGGKELAESVKRNLCSNENWHLRRELIPETLEVFPLNNYGAIVTGEHYFYISETGKKEYRDGMAKFTTVWRFKDNVWKMARILSYNHHPAPKS